MSDKLKRLGIALIVSGPSGSGKTSVCSALRKIEKDLSFSVSCTTRPPRSGEVNGSDYHFISDADFRKRIANAEFLEHAEVHGRLYGTLKSEVLDRVKSGIDVLLDIDVQGAMSIKGECAGDALLSRCVESVFIAPPGTAELERRLRFRATEKEDAIRLRLANARAELEFWKKYDFLVINDQLEKAVEDMRSLLSTLKKSTKRLQGDTIYG